jgi:antitoxin PrlF
MESKLTSKGRVTLPKALPEELHLKPGDKIDFVRNADGSYTFRPRTLSAASLKGFLKDAYNRPPKALEEMEEHKVHHDSEEPD